MTRKTFLNTGKTGTLLFVHVDETTEGGATCLLGFSDDSTGELDVLATHSNPSFANECRDWAEWEQSDLTKELRPGRAS
jgi:hypothetical protein